MESRSYCRKTNRFVLFLAVFACSAVTGTQAFADEHSCDLFAFKASEQSYLFGSEIEVTADCIGHEATTDSLELSNIRASATICG